MASTETKLLATRKQAEKLIEALRDALRKTSESGETAYARVVLEQFSDPGPWRLVIGVGGDGSGDE